MASRNPTSLCRRIVGLTGGIGSGKSVATAALRNAGFFTVDADEVSHTLFAHGTDGEKQLMAEFPQAVRADALDRAALRKIIATDETARQTLNKLTHSRIFDEICRILSTQSSFAIVAAPLLFESRLNELCFKTVCIFCTRDVRIKRIANRDKISSADAERIIDAQMSDERRTALSDYSLNSDIPIDEFQRKIITLFQSLKANLE